MSDFVLIYLLQFISAPGKPTTRGTELLWRCRRRGRRRLVQKVYIIMRCVYNWLYARTK